MIIARRPRLLGGMPRKLTSYRPRITPDAAVVAVASTRAAVVKSTPYLNAVKANWVEYSSFVRSLSPANIAEQAANLNINDEKTWTPSAKLYEAYLEYRASAGGARSTLTAMAHNMKACIKAYCGVSDWRYAEADRMAGVFVPGRVLPSLNTIIAALALKYDCTEAESASPIFPIDLVYMYKHLYGSGKFFYFAESFIFMCTCFWFGARLSTMLHLKWKHVTLEWVAGPATTGTLAEIDATDPLLVAALTMKDAPPSAAADASSSSSGPSSSTRSRSNGNAASVLHPFLPDHYEDCNEWYTPEGHTVYELGRADSSEQRFHLVLTLDLTFEKGHAAQGIAAGRKLTHRLVNVNNHDFIHSPAYWFFMKCAVAEHVIDPAGALSPSSTKEEQEESYINRYRNHLPIAPFSAEQGEMYVFWDSRKSMSSRTSGVGDVAGIGAMGTAVGYPDLSSHACRRGYVTASVIASVQMHNRSPTIEQFNRIAEVTGHVDTSQHSPFRRYVDQLTNSYSSTDLMSDDAVLANRPVRSLMSMRRVGLLHIPLLSYLTDADEGGNIMVRLDAIEKRYCDGMDKLPTEALSIQKQMDKSLAKSFRRGRIVYAAEIVRYSTSPYKTAYQKINGSLKVDIKDAFESRSMRLGRLAIRQQPPLIESREEGTMDEKLNADIRDADGLHDGQEVDAIDLSLGRGKDIEEFKRVWADNVRSNYAQTRLPAEYAAKTGAVSFNMLAACDATAANEAANVDEDYTEADRAADAVAEKDEDDEKDEVEDEEME